MNHDKDEATQVDQARDATLTEANGHNRSTDATEADIPEQSAHEHDDSGDEAATHRSELEELHARESELRDQLLRAAAELENVRKRSARELMEGVQRTREDTLREILPIIDNLERAVEASSSAQDAKAVAEGVAMVLSLFNDDIAQRLGLERIGTQGARFDPACHEAVQRIADDQVPQGHVITELVPGYKLRGRLLRAATVVVSTGSKGVAVADAS